MSAYCIAPNVIGNSSSYSLLYPQYELSSGNWNITPAPVPPSLSSFNAFQAQGAAGSATGAVGTVTYGCYLPNATEPSGTLTLSFSDPYSGDNSCSASTTTPHLSATASYPITGQTCQFIWTVSTPITNGMIVQVTGSAAQYLVLMGQTCLIPDPATESNLFTAAALANILPINQWQFDAIPAGPPLTSGASLGNVGPAIYLLTWGQACLIASPPVFTEYGFNPANVNPISTLPPLGMTITS